MINPLNAALRADGEAMDSDMPEIDAFNILAESDRALILPKDLFKADDMPARFCRRGGIVRWSAERLYFIEYPAPAAQRARKLTNYFIPFPRALVEKKKAEEAAAVAAELARIAALPCQSWKLTAPADDEDLLPRPVRNKGAHPDMQPFLGELRWWRQMMSPQAEADAMPMAANDNEFISAVMDRDPKPLPAEAWLSLWSDTDQDFIQTEVQMPVWVGQQCTHIAPPPAQDGSISYTRTPVPAKRRQLRRVAALPVRRLVRAGGLWFSANDNATAKDKRIERETAKGATKSAYAIPLGAIYAIERGGKKVFVTQDNARNRDDEKVEFIRNAKRGADAVAWALRPRGSDEPLDFRYVPKTTGRRAIQKPVDWKEFAYVRGTIPLNQARHQAGLPTDAKLPTGLPCGSKDIAASFLGLVSTPDKAGPDNVDGADVHAKRVASDLGYLVMDRLGDSDSVEAFRRKHQTESHLLDWAAFARSMTDLAPLVGSNDSGTCKRRLIAAVSTLQAFLQQSAA